ncbi:MAG: FtsX-like permease family protein [Clostridiales bacterium]|nr:FtsX-like permease family protein [Clostridiales bacterium]
MKKRALKKDFRMEIKKSMNRFLSIFLIVALGVSFFSGLQSAAPDMRVTEDTYFDDSNLMDIRVISTMGLTGDDLEAIAAVDGVSLVEGTYMEDVYTGDEDSQSVLHVEAFPETMNQVALMSGALPVKAGECFLDQYYADLMGYEVGDTLEITVEDEEESYLLHRTLTITGTGYSPCYVAINRGSTTLGTGTLSGFVYVTAEEFDSEVYTVVYVQVEGAKDELAYTDAYDDLVEEVLTRIEAIADVRCEARYTEIMEEAESEIEEAEQEVADGKAELEDAKQQLEDSKAEAESELAEAESELLDAEEQLEDGKTELEDSKTEVAEAESEVADGETTLSENEATLADAQSQISDALATLQSNEATYKESLSEYQSQSESATAELQSAQEEIDSGTAQAADGWTQYEAALAEIEDGEAQIAEAEVQLESAKEEYEQGLTALEESQSEYDALAAELSAGRTALQEAEAELADQQSSYEEGRATLDEAWETYEAGAAEFAAGQEAYDEAAAQVEELRTAYDTASEAVSSAQEAYDEAIAAAANAQNAYKSADAAEQEAQEEYDTAASAAASAQGEYDTADSALADAQNAYDTASGAVTSAQSAYDTASEEAASAQSAYDTAAESVSAAQAAYEEAKASGADEAELETLLEKLETAKNALTAEETALAAAKETLSEKESALATAKETLSAKETALATAQSALSAKETALAAAKETLSVKTTALESASQTLAEAETALAAANAQVTELAETIETAKTTASTLKEQLSAADAALAEQKTELDGASATLAATKEQLDEQEETLAEAKAALDAASEQIAEQEATLTAGEAQLAAAKTQLDEGWASLAASAEQIEAAEEELAEQKGSLASAKETLAATKEQLEASESELAAAKKEVDDGYDSLADAKAQLTSARSQLDSGWAQYDSSLSEYNSGVAQLKEGQEELDDARAQIADALEQIADAESEIEENEQKIADGWDDYEEGKAEAEQKIVDAEQEIADAEEEIAEAEQKIADARAELSDVSYPEWYVYDRSSLPENTGYGENADRMTNIAQVFPVIFFLVAALISLTTMTRMVEEERTQIGTLKALGYGKWDVAKKYLKYAFWATMCGSIFGILIGEKLFPWVIIKAYQILYIYQPAILVPYHWSYGLMACGIAVACTVGAAFSACYRVLGTVPAELMRPPAPKQGKRVFLERVTFLWKHLNFNWKSTVRNLMRYKRRQMMTIFGIGGCMGLLLVGYGLRDSIGDVGVLQFNELQTYDAMLVYDADADVSDLSELETAVAAESRIQTWKRFYMQSMDIADRDASGTGKQWTIYVYVPENLDDIDEFLTFRDRTTDEVYELTDEGAIITEKIAKEFDISVGDTISISLDDGGTAVIPIAAICENYLYNYIYLTPILYEELFGEAPEYNSIFFCMADTAWDDAEAVIEEVGTGLLSFDASLSITYVSSLQETIETMLSALDLVIIVLIVSAGLLAFVVQYNLNNININERRRELATLKVLGFYDGEVSAYIFRENVVTTIIGAAAGCLIGKGLHAFVITTVEVDTCMFGRGIYLQSYIYSILFTIAFSLIVNVAMHFKLKKIDMVESLKSIE